MPRQKKSPNKNQNDGGRKNKDKGGRKDGDGKGKGKGKGLPAECADISTCLKKDPKQGKAGEERVEPSDREKREDAHTMHDLSQWYASALRAVNIPELDRLTSGRSSACVLPSSINLARSIMTMHASLRAKQTVLELARKALYTRQYPDSTAEFTDKRNEKVSYVDDNGDLLRQLFLQQDLSYQQQSLAFLISTNDAQFRESIRASFMVDAVDPPSEILFSSSRKTFLLVYGTTPLPGDGGGGAAVEFQVAQMNHPLITNVGAGNALRSLGYDLVIMDPSAMTEFALAIAYHAPSPTGGRSRVSTAASRPAFAAPAPWHAQQQPSRSWTQPSSHSQHQPHVGWQNPPTYVGAPSHATASATKSVSASKSAPKSVSASVSGSRSATASASASRSASVSASATASGSASTQQKQTAIDQMSNLSQNKLTKRLKNMSTSQLQGTLDTLHSKRSSQALTLPEQHLETRVTTYLQKSATA